MSTNHVKIIITTLFLLGLLNKCFAQERSDSLEKYSYKLIMVHDGRTIGYATGFFFRNRKRLYLLSNYHVFTGSNTIKKIPEIEHPFDTILVEYHTLNSNKASFYPLDVSKIKAENKPQFYWEYADVYALPIKIPKNAKIYSIEKFVKVIPDNKDPNEIFAFGYPSETATITGINFGVLDHIAIYRSFPAIINTGDTIQVENSYRVTNEMKPGMSGSPVFLKYGTTDYIFGGVLTSHGANQTIIVKPNEINIAIQKTRNRKNE